METNEKVNRNMIDHVFLPRKLSNETVDLHHTEFNILHLITQTIESIEEVQASIIPSVVRQIFIDMKQLHCANALDPEAISEQLRSMKRGDMLGIYVREQNCGLFIHMEGNEEATLSTFRASLANETIYGEGINGDILVDYPTRAIKVKRSTMLNSEEFSKQIHYLSKTPMDRAMPKSQKAGHTFVEIRNVPQPMYVSQWLMAVASNRFTGVAIQQPIISKKIRDEVIKGEDNLPFRRSGFYTAMKVFLQLGLTIELGAECGRFAYKLIMLKFMSGFCAHHSVDADIAIQMLAKMARRIDKIESLVSSADGLTNELITFKSTVINDVGEIIRIKRGKLDAIFNAIRKEERRTSSLTPMPRLEFERDIRHQIPNLLAYIEKRKGKIGSEPVDNFPKPRRIIRHAWDNMAFPDDSLLNQVFSEIEVLQLLVDFEHWTLVVLDLNYRNYSASNLRKLATAYMSKAQSFYRDDCFGYSKMVLVMLKIIQVMDKAAVEECELLSEYSSGINPKIIDSLLLPTQFHLKIAQQLQIYFEDRNAGAQFPGLLEEDKISRSSFSARFAESNVEMQKVREEILAMAERRIEEKRVEWENARKKVAEMRSRSDQMSHNYHTDRWGDRVHSSWCSKCSLNSQINSYRVEIYERPLKPEEHNQNGVIFELQMPKKIECLRDALYLFVNAHYESSSNRMGTHAKWTAYEQVSQYNRSAPERVFLGSTAKLVKQSHYGESKHPDNSFDEFILDNGYNCVFYAGSDSQLPSDKSRQSVKKYVTFSVESSSVYSTLQWTLIGNSHTQNSVLAKKCDCPQKLNMSEFVNFGSLRADGHRLQLRNLYRVLETEGLSFETQSVLALVMQSLWEAGPLDATRSQWYREAHADYADDGFAAATIELLEKYVEQQESNWKHPLKLIVATIIAVKVFEIVDGVAIVDRIAKLVIYIRKIVIDWISLIVETIGRCPNEQSRAAVYANLAEVAICGVLTYNVSCHHPFFDKIFSDGSEHSSLFAWLHFVVTINNNMLLRGNQYSSIKRILLRIGACCCYNIGVNAEAKIKAFIQKNPEEVYKFVRFLWSESRTHNFEEIKLCDYSPQIIFMAVRSEDSCNYVQVDLVAGEFLVNNLPVASLPKSITDHRLFQRVFGETIFEVQPSNQSFSTVCQYDGFNYIFRLCNGLLIITEQRTDDNDRELIPPEILRDEIPYLLIENHSHWWDKGRGIIEFRPKTFGSRDFSTPNGIEYELDFNKRQLKRLKTQQLLLDICSQSYQRIINFLSRLEQKNYIHVLMDEPAKATVDLMRMHMKFVIDCTKVTTDGTYDVESNEYCGMRVSLDQTFGTLIGLQNGLLLEAIPAKDKSNSKSFVVPHGQVNISRTNHHVSVHVDLVSQSLRKPTFFNFAVDNECRQIKAKSESGWFYLAYLHAVTSYPLPDKFTGMTGTERALQILQSARVWSPSPYDNESIATLRLIAGLTPVRTFYPSHLRAMQQIHWPAAISSTAAQDSYLFIVRKLMSDSQRLSQLHFQTNRIEIESKTFLQLNQRAHARHLPYNPNVNILEKLFQCCGLTRFEATEDNGNVDAVRQLSVFYDENSFSIPSNVENSIYRFLIGKQSIEGTSCETTTNVIDFVSMTDLENLWIRLYDYARLGRLTREHFQLILSYLAFEGKDINQLFILQAIAANAQEFTNINPPPFQEYRETGRHQFEREAVRQVIRSTESGLCSFLDQKRELWGSREFEKRESSSRREYENEVSSVTKRLTDHVEGLWPCDQVGCTSISSARVNVSESIRKIDPLLRMWNDNRKLVNFIREVWTKLKQLTGTSRFLPDKWPIFNVGGKSFPKYAINFEEKLTRNFESSPPNVKGDIETARQIFVEKSDENDRTLSDWWKIFENISIPWNDRHLVDSGLYPRLVPSLVLPKLLEPICEQRKYMIGAIAVMTTREQRKQRIGRFEHQPQMELTLRRERENQPQANWMPHERPEWLLFEIEMDLSIRRIQVEIAERMIQPPGGQHSVMQLNMGEGKTAVIVPILAAVLADGNKLCTVTVLKSLFHTNLRSLRQCLGGMLNRRIYTFPCRRDMKIEAVAGDLLSIYDECKRERGVVMTLPEYRLSFQLKLYEAARKGDTSSATNFLDVHKWLNRNARHILDESDAILDAKYQLIYTVGAQLPPDGGALRWTIVQAVLKRVPHHMERLFRMHGDEAVEFSETYQIGGTDYGHGDVAKRPEVFRPCRLLDEKIYTGLLDALIDDFLQGELNILFPEITLDIREQIRCVLRNPSIGCDEYTALLNQFEDLQKKTILILSGLFKFEVLRLALMKRWRVNYGVNSTGKRKMAVPFRAKDVAAEMTEFGHPDVAICLTHLSYYYSGLTDEQLYETFDVLALTENPEDFYDEWIRSIPRHLVPNSILSYTGINLSDPGQRDTQLFPLLRFNMHVIDYWLSNRVFPREAKIFEGKLMCTAWDLCSERLNHVVTGFSGTNDTKLLLPMPVEQNDLPELEATNENVRQILLRGENNRYRAMRSNVSGMEILHQLVADGIPVLLDAGALMLELNNEQTAREWLELASIGTYDAAIFFSKDDILMTIDRNGFITEFEYSVYRERLSRCLVYLDDVHTRGTDLKFPSGIRACVTLSGRITRDKTVQACMRMRMLGQGHMVSFYASLEADIGIRALNDISDGECVTTEHVVCYICNNSGKYEREGMVHWSAAGLNYTQKLAAHECFEEQAALSELAERCTDPENTPLIDMYGAKEVQFLTNIMHNQFNRIAAIYGEQKSIFNWINQTGKGVVLKLQEHIPDEKRYTQLLDEEQEKELEHELEEQREKSRPPPMEPMIPRLNPLLRELFTHGKSHSSFVELRRSNALQKLPFAFAKSALFSIVEPQTAAWDDNIFVTEDFLSVVQLAAHDRDDDFFRPVWWIARAIDPCYEDAFVLLSTFEYNALLPTIASSKKSISYMFSPKLSLSHSNLLNNENLKLPANSPKRNIPVAKAVQIAVFAGSMYFNDKQEETAYCNSMGCIPRPRIDEHQQAFEDGDITSSGYVPPVKRARFAELAEMCRFTENPDKIVIGIIERRHDYLRAQSHVASLLLEGKEVRWTN